MATAAIAPAVGALSSLLGGLLGGMQRRAKQATDENTAENIAVAGFDSDLKTIQQAVNNGQVTPDQAVQAVSVARSNFWNTMTPHIQPGRNGCSSGASCVKDTSPNNTGDLTGGAIQYEKGYCTGNIGGTCCIGCGSIQKSIDNVLAVLNAGGGTADIITVYGNSKYGSGTRQGYTLTFSHMSTPMAGINQAVSGLNAAMANGLTPQLSSLAGSALGLTPLPSGGFSISSTTVLIFLAFFGLLVSLGVVGARRA
jgi:hypothetical protein